MLQSEASIPPCELSIFELANQNLYKLVTNEVDNPVIKEQPILRVSHTSSS